MQIIVGALLLGVVTFGLIVVAVVVGPQQLQPRADMMTIMAAAFALVSIGASLLIPQMLVAAARRQIATGKWQPPAPGAMMPPALAELGEAGQLVMVYQTAMIVGAALLEGAAFFGIIATMIEKSSLALAVSGVCVVLLLAKMPTIGRLSNWLDAQSRAMEADRMRL